MLGIFLTIAAVLLVICFAFCLSDHPAYRGARADSLFFITPRRARRNCAHRRE